MKFLVEAYTGAFYVPRGAVPVQSRETVSTELASDNSAACSANQRAVESRRAGPASRTRTIAPAMSSGDEDGRTNPFTPSSISSVAALSAPATTMLGTPRAAASTTMRP